MKLEECKEPQQILEIKTIWLIIATSMCVSLGLFIYGITLPASDRIRGDAFQYLSIANSFNSLYEAISYIGDRTYGFPFFLYIIKIITSPVSFEKWTIATSYVQFLLHIISCLVFYLFFLKNFLQKGKFLRISASLVTAILIAYPTLITYTTIPLTDTFCVDLLMIAAVFYLKALQVNQNLQNIIYASICGFLLGYILMIRPSFLLPMSAFYLVLMQQGASEWRVCKRQAHTQATSNDAAYSFPMNILLKIIIMSLCTCIMALPTAIHFYAKDGEIALQNQKFRQSPISASLESGLSAVRVYWSGKYQSFVTVPGIRDPFLYENYSSRCDVDSLTSLGKCLISRPFAIPVYFEKKTIALFDVPHLQPYAVDLTPSWFPILTRLFEVVAFCGFIALIMTTISYPFFRVKPIWIGLPWSVFVLGLVSMHTLFHVEGRYGFPAIPFSVASLFLGFAAARESGSRFFIWWTGLIVISVGFFIYQIYAWDLIPPV